MELQTLVSNRTGYGTKSESTELYLDGKPPITHCNGKPALPPAGPESKDGCLALSESYTKDQISDFVGFMHFLRGFVGSGFLVMPYAVKLVGLWSGAIGIMAMGWMASFNILTLINCSQTMCKRYNLPALDYVDLFEYAMSIGPQCSRNFAKTAKTVIAVVLTVANVGYCIVYISTAAAYMQQLVPLYIDNQLFLRPYIVVFCVMAIPICMTTTLTVLAPFSTLGNIVSCINIVIVFQYMCKDLPNVDTRPWFTGVYDDRGLVLIAISNIMFSYEGIGSVLPIENRIVNKHQYGGWNGLAGLGMTIVVCLYTACGFFGFLKFGEATEPSLLLNLPSDQALYKCIKVLNVFVLYSSVGFQIFVPSKVIWQGIERRVTSGTLVKYGEYIVRLLIMLFMTLFTMAVPNMDLLLPLVGAMCGSSLAFVFPPLMMTFILWVPEEKDEESKWKRIKHKFKLLLYISLFLLGINFTLFGTVDAVLRIINRYA
ncbi:proton-coupled amino acid transporter 2-like [Mizuhopecten yessoensis]|uniref:Proton-coupled amino acid transporter 4 n=1 Tax=Mizuhopecten yessoensis TaxID=6573 RepID=A0A210R0H5_MIZYE|nr:proton-coupled amino acid transporter 2-like [Mizuhopecten yessoensis]OWF54499.1 Proton-coupled amino acid transporter 4 [Mizuhopecten yessoensis]